MQSFRTTSTKRPNSRQRQTRAIVNLRQLSQTPWVLPYDQKTGNLPIKEDKLLHTGESVELPLNPVNNDNSKRFFLSSLKARPQTIQHHSLQSSNSKRYQVRPKPFTSINFYQNNPIPYGTLDVKSRLNQDLQMFASKIKKQGKLIQSFESERSKSRGLKDANTSFSFKSNVTRKSLLYKQVKNYLYDSFKVDGKPVEIKWDRYSIESHGLPQRKSVYSFKDQNTENISLQQKTEILLKKVQRYQFQQQKDQSILNSIRKKSTSLYDNSALEYAHQTLHTREKNSKNKLKGKLWLGRPPTSLVIQQTES